MIDLLLSLVLQGGIQEEVSKEEGRIGVSMTGTKINHIWKVSPAADWQLQENDIVISADGYKGTGHILGPVGSLFWLKIKRGDEILDFYIVRDSWSRVKDKKEAENLGMRDNEDRTRAIKQE